MHYKLININFHLLKSKIKVNYVYEPEVSSALIWIFPGVKMYIYPNNTCDLFITDISCVDNYIETMGTFFSALEKFIEEVEEARDEEVPPIHTKQHEEEAGVEEEEEDTYILKINNHSRIVNKYGEIV
jgi:hypothetical protein